MRKICDDEVASLCDDEVASLCDDEVASLCDDEVASSLLAKGTIVEVCDASVGVILIPKKIPGKFRPIVNIKYLNSFIRHEHFKMGNLETVRTLIRKGDFMAKIGLMGAYFTVPFTSFSTSFL